MTSVMIDYRAVRDDEVSVNKGDVVTVVSSNLTRGYLVHVSGVSHVSPPAEGWISSYCLHLPGANLKKQSAWAFRIRKQSFSKLGKHDSSSSLGRGFVEHLNNVSITVGEQCIFTCRVENPAGCQIVWKGPGGGLLQSGGRVQVHVSDTCHVTLTLDNCQLSDLGDYYCILANEDGSVCSSASMFHVRFYKLKIIDN